MNFKNKLEIDFQKLTQKEVLEKIFWAKENKHIAVAKNYQNISYLKPAPQRFDYLVVNSGHYVINNYNGYIKLSTVNATDGYHTFYLFTEGKMRQIYAHRLVAMAFIPKVKDKPEVDHINRDRSNNSVDNLRWANREEQIANRNI